VTQNHGAAYLVIVGPPYSGRRRVCSISHLRFGNGHFNGRRRDGVRNRYLHFQLINVANDIKRISIMPYLNPNSAFDPPARRWPSV
jgi:hypothetical protein